MGLEIVKHSWYGTDYPGFVCKNCGSQTTIESNMSQFHLASFLLFHQTGSTITTVTCRKCQYKFTVQGSLKEACQRLITDHRIKTRESASGASDYIAAQRELQGYIHPVWYILSAIIVIVIGCALWLAFWN